MALSGRIRAGRISRHYKCPTFICNNNTIARADEHDARVLSKVLHLYRDTRPTVKQCANWIFNENSALQRFRYFTGIARESRYSRFIYTLSAEISIGWRHGGVVSGGRSRMSALDAIVSYNEAGGKERQPEKCK